MILAKAIALIFGLTIMWPAVLCIVQPREAGQDYSPFDLIVGVLLTVPAGGLLDRPWAGIQRSVMTDSMARDLAEFDRALLLDAWDALESQYTAIRNGDANPTGRFDEADAIREAINTIAATLRSEP